MKANTMTSLLLLIMCCLYSGVNSAHGFRGGHSHSSFGFYLGGPLYSYPYYRDPFYSPYYSPTIITVPVTPPVYIQQTPPAAQQYPPGYWYYCGNPEGYYPYIKECPRGWQQVEPIPPSPR